MSDCFFPNQPATLVEQEWRLRCVAERMPQSERLELYSAFSICVPNFVSTTFRCEPGFVVVQQCGTEIAFPSPVPLVKLSHIIFGYEQWLERKYCLPGFVEVEFGDVVVDCGAYVGGFSLSAGKLASQLHAFEPDSANASCARRNLEGQSHIRVVEAGLYDHSDTMILNVSTNSVEHSLLQPDDDIVVERRPIPVVSLRDYAAINHLDHFDFVKIEAEGVELEVFDGLGDLRPRKLAIDVSPERNGESPAEEFRSRLQPLGYEVRQRAHVMFARLP